jgi:hypothetical protein
MRITVSLVMPLLPLLQFGTYRILHGQRSIWIHLSIRATFPRRNQLLPI